MPGKDYLLYLMIFALGVVVGRISMAFQYAFMKRLASRKS